MEIMHKSLLTNGVNPHAVEARLRQRLLSLNITLAHLDRSRGPRIGESGQLIDHLIIESSLFRKLTNHHWPNLVQAHGTAISMWPGLWLIPLPSKHGEKNHRDQDPFWVAVLYTDALLHCEQLHQICERQGHDYHAIVQQIDPTCLISEAQLKSTASMITWLHQDANELTIQSTQIQTMSSELHTLHEELSLLHKLSTHFPVSQPPDVFLSQTCEDLLQVMRLSWTAVQLVEDEPRLNELSGRIFIAGSAGCNNQLLQHIGRQLIAMEHRTHDPMLVDDTNQVDIKHLPQVAKTLLAVPLMRENKLFGILFGGDKTDGSAVSTIGTPLCTSMAAGLSIYLENTMLYDDMHALFLGTLHALTSAVDAKDTYTHGHSERVALIGRMLAEAAGLDDHMIERVYLSGLVHDVGKIGVPETVLSKTGPLTTEEFYLIKQHPIIGTRILADIPQMHDLIPGVQFHHERWDGNGYPEGRRGYDIPLFGRILCLADSFDAMSSDRGYRQSLDLNGVCHNIAQCKGTQFDPDLADIFLQMELQPYHDLVKVQYRAARQERMSA